MRVNIRIKLFMIIIGILLLTALVFASTVSLILDKMLIKEYESALKSNFEDFKCDFSEDLNFSEYLRVKEKGVRGFITLFDNEFNVIESTSPELSHVKILPLEYQDVHIENNSYPNADATIFRFTLGRLDVEALGVIGKVSPQYNVFYEKSLSSISDAMTMSIKAMIITMSLVLIIGIILAYFFARIYTKPILKLNEKAQAISNLDFEHTLQLKNNDEIGDLGDSINEISTKLKHNIGELKESNLQLEEDQRQLKALNKQLEKLSQTDPLTKLANRLKINLSLEDEVYRTDFRGRTFSIMLLDIDNFKLVNDQYGHQVGDCVLIDIAKILKDNSRRMDLVGRWGGEEFIIILTDTHQDGALSMAEKLRGNIEEYDFQDVGKVTASIGVGEYVKGMAIETFISKIDEALYRAKENGRNCVEQIDI
ncbi:MAG: diguanylate cyclase [Clostridiales bacterium]|nr:diguanylate cyclase [Clostridiales bacterium]